MKKVVSISLFLCLAMCGVQAQLTRHSMHQEYCEMVKVEVLSTNIMAILFMAPKYSWPLQAQKIVTPLVVFPTVGITIVKGIEYNYHKLASRAPKWFVKYYRPRMRFENRIELLRRK